MDSRSAVCLPNQIDRHKTSGRLDEVAPEHFEFDKKRRKDRRRSAKTRSHASTDSGRPADYWISHLQPNAIPLLSTLFLSLVSSVREDELDAFGDASRAIEYFEMPFGVLHRGHYCAVAIS
jgi:hypothetical protein